MQHATLEAFAKSADKTATFQYLATGMKDKQAFAICVYLKTVDITQNTQLFDELEAFCKEALKKEGI